MPPHPAPFRLAAPAAAAVLAMLAGAAVAAPPRPAPAPAPSSSVEGDAAQAIAALAGAQGRAAQAAATVDELKRELGPGHLTDPMPETDRAFGLTSLRSDYADAQRREAGYRATLGDRHPTLLATVQVMDDLRAQLLDGTRKALASAERDAAQARADTASAERRLAAPAAARSRPAEARAADVTGGVAAVRPPARAASPLSLPPAALPVERQLVAEAPPARPVRRSPRTLVTAAAAAALAALLAAFAVLRLLRPRRPRAAPHPVRRVEPAFVPSAASKPAAEQAPEPAAAVPVLQRLALPLSGESLAAAGLAAAAAGLHATLRAASGDDAGARMTVLVAPAAGLPVPEADAAAFALALAAAAAGRRPVLMEARAAGRLRGALVSPGSAPMLIEAGGASRTLYRLGPADAPVALLPSDAGEAEAALAADARPGTARLRGLDAFDTVILVGDDDALAANADLLLLAAPAGAAAAALAEAALPFGAAGRPCGAVLIDPAPAAGPAASPVVRSAPLPRRRLPAEAARDVRLGLRGSIEPTRRRIGG